MGPQHYTPKMLFSYPSETANIFFLTPQCHTKNDTTYVSSLLMSTTICRDDSLKVLEWNPTHLGTFILYLLQFMRDKLT